MGIEEGASYDVTELLNEAFYLAQGIHIEQIQTVCKKSAADIRKVLSQWSKSLQIQFVESEGDLRKDAVSAAHENDAGIVVIPYTGRSLLKTIFRNDLVKMANELPCPLLLARFTDPNERVLVPFNGSPASRRALEIAMDMSRQLDADISVVIVVEPSYLDSESSSTEQWDRHMLNQVRELARVHRIKVEEHVRHGNPVKEVLDIAGDYQLLVLGGDDGEPGLFSFDVTDMLADKAECSVLLIT